MFDIHKIKPVHGWREFIGEVGIIVLGVLIALAAESAIEEWRWHEQVEQTRNALKAEILDGSTNAVERLAINDCLRADIASLLHNVTSIGSGSNQGKPVTYWRPSPDFAVVPQTYAAPNRPYIFDSWKNTLASGVFNHLSSEERRDYAELAITIDELSLRQRAETEAATRLAPLSFDGKLDAHLRSEYIAALALVDQHERALTIYAQFFIDTVRKMHLRFEKSAVDASVKEMLDDERSFRGRCVHDVHLDLG